MVTESKAGDLLPHRPAVPAAPPHRDRSPSDQRRYKRQPCPRCLAKSQRGSGAARCVETSFHRTSVPRTWIYNFQR